MSINPNDFVKLKNNEEQEGLKVTGTFVCQNCMESIGFAILDEDSMVLKYTCAAGHNNEAKL
jgi:hypothetical protein